jgi:pyridoxine 5-phosphate synthase
MLLGVNIDHIAVLREARRINDPDPIDALGILKRAGADQVTIHLREDRRHIQDEDAKNIAKLSFLPLNIECSIAPEIVEIVSNLHPNRVTLVPEKREEVTTEGGLDVAGSFEQIQRVVNLFHKQSIEVSLFIDPNLEQIKKAAALHVEWVELHTGSFANIYASLYSNLLHSHHRIESLNLPKKSLKKALKESLELIKESAKVADSLGLNVAAGHGLNYQNVTMISPIKEIKELNIGQSIIARSIFTGLERAISDMKKLVE